MGGSIIRHPRIVLAKNRKKPQDCPRFIYGSNTKREREIVNKKNFNQSFPPDKSLFFQTSTVFLRRPCRGSMKFMGTSRMAPWLGGFLRLRDVPRLFCKGYLQHPSTNSVSMENRKICEEHPVIFQWFSCYVKNPGFSSGSLALPPLNRPGWTSWTAVKVYTI